MKALIVDPDATRAAGVADALVAAGVEASVAPSGSFAITMLEWNRQDVIVSRAQVGDMDGRELCTMIRSDPSTHGVRFVLVANDVTAAQSTEVGIDLVIPEGLIGQAIVTRVMHLMRRTSEAVPPPAPAPPQPDPLESLAAATRSAFREPDPPLPLPSVSPANLTPEPAYVAAEPAVGISDVNAEPAPMQALEPPPAAEPVPAPALQVSTPVPPAPAPPAPPSSSAKGAAPPPPPLTELDAVGLNGATRTFQGALGSLALETLAQAIASGTKTGRLLVVLASGGGMIAFDEGRVVHAEVGGTTGETAFHTLVVSSHRESGGKFCFIPSASRDLANVPKTITRSVAQLLEGATKALHEEK